MSFQAAFFLFSIFTISQIHDIIISEQLGGGVMKKLVVYYSLSGNTRAVAKRIAQTLRADLMEIRTIKTYPDDYDVLVGLGEKEVKSGYMPQIAPLTYDANEYGTIIIGTPVWWYTYAPAVKKFMSTVRWKGKKVYPFTTNGGELGHTPSDFRKALRGAVVSPVLSIRFNEGVQVTEESDVKEWVAEIK